MRHLAVCVATIAALPVLGQMPAWAAASAAPGPPVAASSHTMPFLSQRPALRATGRKGTIRRAGSVGVKLVGTSGAAGSGVHSSASVDTSSQAASTPAAPTTPVSPDNLFGFAGTAQASTINSFGADQKVTPPNEDIAAGPNQLVEVVNSAIVVFNRAGVVAGSDDLNHFMNVASGHHSSDPRVIFDVETGRFWVTISEIPNSGCAPAPVLIAVSASSNPLPLSSWLVYSLPFGIAGTTFGDQPGLGADSATMVVTFDDFNCSQQFIGSEFHIIQKSDLEHHTVAHADDFFVGPEFAPQPVMGYRGHTQDWVITNESDCGVPACTTPEAEMDLFQGTPESGGVFVEQFFVPMAPTEVDNTTGFLPPADQPNPGPRLQTNDDRFLNAVEDPFDQIWAADGTSCQPAGDTVQRACLDYVEININTTPALTAQLNNVGVSGADLMYPEVAVDNNGNLITVFDESSMSMFPSIMDAEIPAGGSTMSGFQTLHTSSTYYNGAALFSGACGSEGCRWGDYSGATQDTARDGNDVWVVSESEDNSVEGACVAHACWNTRVDQLTLGPPMIVSETPSFGTVDGGQTVTVAGHDFASDTTFAAEVSPGVTLPIPVHILSPELLTYVTPPAAAVGGALIIDANDSLGGGGGANLYQYTSLANYVSVPPFRVLDTRAPGAGGALGPGEIRSLQVSGVGPTPVPSNATAIVLNVTAIDGTAASLLTIFQDGSTRPNASNLNFGAHTVVPNLVTTASEDGIVEIYNALGRVDVAVDVEGYFLPEPSSDFNGLFHPMVPLRVCDTRANSPTPACTAHGPLGAGASMRVTVTGGAGGIPGDGTAGAAVLNLTGVAGTASTFLSVFPTNSSGGCTFPGTSTLNLQPGAVEANRVMVQLGPATTGGPDTSVCVFNAAGTINVLLDANGWFGGSTAGASPVGYQYQAMPSTRICDTRVGSASCTKASIGAAVTRLIGVAGDEEIPAADSGNVVVAIIANLTAVAPTQATFLTLYPANLPSRPNVSDLNVNAGAVLPNLAVVGLDTMGDAHDGAVDLYNSAGSVNAIIDLEGWFQ